MPPPKPATGRCCSTLAPCGAIGVTSWMVSHTRTLELAAFLNENFICIKVDRDERPDVDARYQRAVQMLTQQGGWPLTAFLTPRGEVFFGGTYFPPDGKFGRPGFRTVLASVLDAYRSRRDQVQAQAQAIRRVLDEQLNEAAPGEVSPALLDRGRLPDD